MENNKNKKSVKFQGDMLSFFDFIQVFVFTPNHHLKRTVDEQNRHKIINSTTSIDSAQHGPYNSDMKQQKKEMRMSVTTCPRIIAWHAEYEVTEYTSKGTTSTLFIIESRRKHGGKHG